MVLYISKFAKNCSVDKVLIVGHLSITIFFGKTMVSLETEGFSDHINILRAFKK